nr:uncharacterized mitochondrial protein AtMg00810-like [Tanacetum cinerariifolium]
MSIFLGLKNSQSPRGIFINQSKYASEIVKKYGMLSSDSVDTPLVEKSKLDEHLQGKPVDATLYHGLVGSLMYLTSSRPDLAYAVCLYARYQAKPIEKHLNAIKWVFRYLKRTINMGLWYLKDTGLKNSQSPRGIFINQSKYASEIVKKYGMLSSDSVDTPLVEKSKLDEHLQGKPVDATLYHGLVGSLTYLTSSRPDLTYAVCLCARYQAKPIEKHLNAVKWVFRYLKRTINMGLIMDTSQAQQKALDDALVAPVNHLKIGKCNLRLISTLKSKEPTLQVVLDALKLTPFYKAFEITADVPKIYMQEFWVTNSIHHTSLRSRYMATATVHHHSIRFKMDNKKHIVNLESFREMLHICPRLLGQSFVEPPFEEEILAFLWFFRHSGAIMRLTDVNINKLHQPWDDHMFTTIKLVSRHQNTQQFSAMLPIDLTNEDIKNFNAYKEHYAVATGATPPKPKASVRKTRSIIIDYIMKNNLSIPRRNKMFWHTARDDPMFTMIRVISKHQTTQICGAILPKQLTNKAMIELEAYKTYYTYATGEKTPKLKYVQKKADYETSPKKNVVKAPKGKRLKATAKVPKSGKKELPTQGLETSHPKGSGTHKGTGVSPGVPDVPTYGSDDEQISWKSSDDDDADNQSDDDGQDDDNEQTKSDNDGDDFVHPKDNVEEEKVDEDKTNTEEMDELYSDVNINLEGRDTDMTYASLANVQAAQVIEDTHVIMTTVTPEVQNHSSFVSLGFITNMLNPNLDRGIDSILNLNTKSTSLVDVPVTMNVEMPPSSFEDRIKTLEDNFSEFKQTNLFAEAVSSIPENDEFLKTINENMQKIIKEQVKEQVKVQLSKILPKIEQTVNEQLKAEVLTRSSNSSKTSYAVAADLSEMELKKILIEKMEGNKSIEQSNEQKNFYKALVEAYESNKFILDTYGDTVTLKRRRDNDIDKDKEPSAGSDRGSKRRRKGKEPESASALKEKATRSAGKSTQGSKSRQMSARESATAEEPMQTTFEMEEPSHPEFETGADDQPIVEPSQHPECDLAKLSDSRSSFNELMDTPVDFSNFLMNRLKVDTLTPELLAGPTFELMKGSCKSLTKAADYGHIKWIEDLVPRTMWIQEPISYDKQALWGISHWGRKRQ